MLKRVVKKMTTKKSKHSLTLLGQAIRFLPINLGYKHMHHIDLRVIVSHWDWPFWPES